MKNLKAENKIRVNFFQRKPRTGFSFSIEYIFDDIRNRLRDKIDAKVFISNCYNDGYLTKFYNIFEAALRQRNQVNHITGEVHFLNLLMRKKRVILTIHDCGMLRRKTGLSKTIVNWLYLAAPVKKAQLVTTVSEETKKEIIAATGLKSEKIHVIPVAVHPRFQPKPKKFNREKPTILHIGTGYNKNLVRLSQALSGISCKLIIIGKLSDEYLDALKTNNIDYTNEYNISYEQMLEKYEECDILSFVSTFEGFGMPIVEANAVERVVVTSNISSMPEVAGDAAYLVNPLNVDAIRSGILHVINDEMLREKLINNGRKNKLRFNADKVADMYYNLYKKIAG
jgi:glycosyltransferase involved in cell wall biosynthesis